MLKFKRNDNNTAMSLVSSLKRLNELFVDSTSVVFLQRSYDLQVRLVVGGWSYFFGVGFNTSLAQ